VLSYHSDEMLRLGAFSFQAATQQTVLAPSVITCSGFALDCNPDIASSITGDWHCEDPAPYADGNLDPLIADSSIGCVDSVGDGPTLAPGANIKLADISYTGANGSTLLNLHDAVVFDDAFVEVGSCNPTVTLTMSRRVASVHVGPPHPATPTFTPPPTVAPTATPTPRGPVPSVSDAFAIFVDCDILAYGIQIDCAPPAALPSIDVDLVLVNESESAVQLGVLTFGLSTAGSVLSPLEVASETDVSTPMRCQSAGAQWSSIDADTYVSCWSNESALEIPSKGVIRIARVRYMSLGGDAGLTIHDAGLYDESYDAVASCPPTPPVSGMACGTSSLWAGQSLTPPPAPTRPPPPPPATSTPTRTAVPCDPI